VIAVQLLCDVGGHFHQQNAEAESTKTAISFSAYLMDFCTTNESVWGGRELTNYNDVVTLSPAAHCTYPLKSIFRDDEIRYFLVSVA
jgi:hypothetical protein